MVRHRKGRQAIKRSRSSDLDLQPAVGARRSARRHPRRRQPRSFPMVAWVERSWGSRRMTRRLASTSMASSRLLDLDPGPLGRTPEPDQDDLDVPSLCPRPRPSLSAAYRRSTNEWAAHSELETVTQAGARELPCRVPRHPRPTPRRAHRASARESAAWLERLPDTIRDLERRWFLTLGAPFSGSDTSCAWVASATLADETSAVLKIGMPHMEGEHELHGLRWEGDPTWRRNSS